MADTELQVGDRIYSDTRLGGVSFIVIDKVTPKFAFSANKKFHRSVRADSLFSDIRPVDRWFKISYQVETEDLKNKYQAQVRRSHVLNGMKSATDDQIKRIWEILNDGK